MRNLFGILKAISIGFSGPDRTWIPSTHIMCLESFSHLLVMIASSSNFIIYCTISTKFKIFLKCRFLFRSVPHPNSNSVNSNGLVLKSLGDTNALNHQVKLSVRSIKQTKFPIVMGQARFFYPKTIWLS